MTPPSPQFATALLLLVPLGPSVAQEAPGDLPPEIRRVLDTRVRRSVNRVIRRGVTLFNDRGDRLGCYRLYEGALIALEPLLGHRPDLLLVIDRELRRAEEVAATDPSGAAFLLRGVLDRVFEQTGATPMADAARPLWERLGGEATIAAIVRDFVALAASDEEVNFARDGEYELTTRDIQQLERRLVEFISEATGGPLEYSGRPMEPVHRGMRITGEEFAAMADDLTAVLRSYQVPPREMGELLAIIATTKDDIVEVEPLWERLGGEDAVAAVVEDFVRRTANNPEVNFFRDGRYALDGRGVRRLQRRLVEFISAATGGPLEYSGRDMATVHEDMGITAEEFAASADDLVASLRAFDVPPDLIDELMAIVATTRGDIVEGPADDDDRP